MSAKKDVDWKKGKLVNGKFEPPIEFKKDYKVLRACTECTYTTHEIRETHIDDNGHLHVLQLAAGSDTHDFSTGTKLVSNTTVSIGSDVYGALKTDMKRISQRWWTTGIPIIDIFYLPYTLMTTLCLYIGAMLFQELNWSVINLVALGWFIAVGLASHALDELEGRPLNTPYSDKRLWQFFGIGIGIPLVIAVYLSFTHSPFVILWFIVYAFALVSYNYELFGGIFHKDIAFAIFYIPFPMVFGYWLMAGSFPTLWIWLFFLALTGTGIVETTTNHFIKHNSQNHKMGYVSVENDQFAYLERSVWATLFIIYFMTIALVVWRVFYNPTL